MCVCVVWCGVVCGVRGCVWLRVALEPMRRDAMRLVPMRVRSHVTAQIDYCNLMLPMVNFWAQDTISPLVKERIRIMYTIDDVIYASRIEVWHDNHRNKDCALLCLAWSEIASQYAWACNVMMQAEFNPDSIDGMYGNVSSHYEDAMDELGM